MFLLNKIMRKLNKSVVLANIGDPNVQPNPSFQAPSQLQPAPAAQPASGIGSSFKQGIESAVISEMKKYLQDNYRAGTDIEELEINMNPVWKSRYYNLWKKALADFQGQMAAPQPVLNNPSVAPIMNYKEIRPDILRQKIEPHIRENKKMLSYEELPAVIREVPKNLENYYDIGNRILRDMEDEESKQGLAQTADPQHAQVKFSNPMAQTFWQMYLSPDAENNQQFHELFQGSTHDRFGPQNASDISDLDSFFSNRVPEGHSGGKTYDPVIGFLLSDQGRQHAGPFVKAYRKAMGQESGPVDKPSLAKFIARKYMDKVDEKIQDLMYTQDPGLAKYIAGKTRMKGEGAGRSGAMIDNETGGVRDMGEDQNYSSINKNVVEKEKNQETLDSLKQALSSIPAHVESLADGIKGKLQSDAQKLKQTPGWQNSKDVREEVGKKEATAALISAYTSAMRISLEGMYQKANSGQLTDEEIKEMKKQGLIDISTEMGKVKIKPNASMSMDDIANMLDFSALVPPSKILPHFADQLEKNLGPDAAAEFLGTRNQKLDLNTIRPGDRFDKKEFDGAKKRMYMKSQFLLNDVSDTLMEMLGEGKTDPSTAIAFLNMLKPHGQSKAMGNIMAHHGKLEEAKKWVRKQSPVIRKVPVLDEAGQQVIDPLTKKPKTRIAYDEAGNPIFDNSDTWLAKQMNSGEIPRIRQDEIDKMSDEEFKNWVMGVAEKYYNSPKEMDNTKRQVANYFAQILDYGKSPSWKDWDTYKKNNKKASVIYDILYGTIIKMSGIISLRNGLSKYASCNHLDTMIDTLISSAKKRIEVEWNR